MQARTAAFLVVAVAACGSSSGSGGNDAAPGATTSPTPPPASVAPPPPPAPPPDGGTPSGDPTRDGPFAIAELDATAKVASTGDDVPVHVALPKTGGPFPVVVLAHGFQIPASVYQGYVRRLATFGYVAIDADYPAGFTSVDNVRDAKNLVGALDWAASATELAGRAAVAKSGVMGHSRGGKAAVLAAARDARFVAVLGLDPVDAKPPLSCDPVNECPDARAALATLSIPSAFLGETTDATASGLGQACAPADSNYATFYTKAKSPSLEITIAGANHMSFVDDPAACGFVCSVCRAETAKHDDVLSLARAVSVAFFERHIRGDAAYAAYLDGASAQTLWVAPGLATISSK